MLALLSRNWWIMALRGLLAVLFGLAALVWPDVTLTALVFLFGAYVLVDGLFSAISAVRDRGSHPQWWVVLLEGVAGIAIGVLAFVWPDLTALALLILIAVWALFTGIMEIIAAIRLREEIKGELLLAISGILSVAFGVLLVIWPASGALAVTWLIGLYALLFGILLIVLGFRLRDLRQRLA